MFKSELPSFCPINCKYKNLFCYENNGITIYKCKNAEICKQAYKLANKDS
jgi:hypothetical protein